MIEYFVNVRILGIMYVDKMVEMYVKFFNILVW